MEKNERTTDVLIIGGGPAGTQAARFIRQKSPETRVTVVRPEDRSLIYCAIPYAIEGLFPLAKTFKSDDLVTGIGAELIRAKATAIDPKKRTVTLDDGGAIRYEKLFIATGASPLRPNIPGADLENIFTVKTAADALAILRVIQGGADCDPLALPVRDGRPIRAVVIGAGAIGLEQAAAYRAHDIEVELVEMAEYPLPNLIDADMAEEPTRELERLGVRIRLGAAVKRFLGEKEVAGVTLSNGETIDLEPGRDFAVLAIGMRPDLGCVAGIGLEIDRDGIVVNERMRTRIPGVWAAGDCVAFKSGVDGKPIGGKLATNAVPMGKTAAMDMLGLDSHYPGFYNGAVTIVGNLRVGGTGFTETTARARGFETLTTYGETTTRFPMMPGAGKVRVKLVFDRASRRLLGGQVVGTEAVAERIDLLTLAIQHRLVARDLARFSYCAQPWQTFLPARNAIVEAAELAAESE